MSEAEPEFTFPGQYTVVERTYDWSRREYVTRVVMDDTVEEFRIGKREREDLEKSFEQWKEENQ